MTHPHHETALMLLRAAKKARPEEILAMAAAVDAEKEAARRDYFAVLASVKKMQAREKVLREALDRVLKELPDAAMLLRCDGYDRTAQSIFEICNLARAALEDKP